MAARRVGGVGMQSLIGLFWDVCLLRRGPQDVPYSPALLGALLVAGVAVDLVFFSWQAPLANALAFVSASLGAMLTVISLLLGGLGYARRIVQTLTAMGGAGLVFSALALPALVLVLLIPALRGPLALLMLVLNLWSLVVTAHILRHALSVHLVPAALLAVGYFYLHVVLADSLLRGAS